MTEDQKKLALDLARQIWPDGFSDECPCDECNYMTKIILEFAAWLNDAEMPWAAAKELDEFEAMVERELTEG